MCIECYCPERKPIYPASVQKAISRMEQSTFVKPLRINGIIQREVAMLGFNMYFPNRVEWFDIGSETWIAAEIPEFVFYMETAAEIVAYLHNFLNLCPAPAE